jgi:hypothetical protein
VPGAEEQPKRAPSKPDEGCVLSQRVLQVHAVITTGRKWDPMIATHGTKHHPMPVAA